MRNIAKTRDENEFRRVSFDARRRATRQNVRLFTLLMSYPLSPLVFHGNRVKSAKNVFFPLTPMLNFRPSSNCEKQLWTGRHGINMCENDLPTPPDVLNGEKQRIQGSMDVNVFASER